MIDLNQIGKDAIQVPPQPRGKDSTPLKNQAIVASASKNNIEDSIRNAKVTPAKIPV